jgi:hypothetical protein
VGHDKEGHPSWVSSASGSRPTQGRDISSFSSRVERSRCWGSSHGTTGEVLCQEISGESSYSLGNFKRVILTVEMLGVSSWARETLGVVIQSPVADPKKTSN